MITGSAYVYPICVHHCSCHDSYTEEKIDFVKLYYLWQKECKSTTPMLIGNVSSGDNRA